MITLELASNDVVRDEAWLKARAKAYSRASYLRNREKKLIYAKEYRRNKPEVGRASSRRWNKANPDKIAKRDSDRRALRKNRTHPEANHQAIMDLFVKAEELSRSTGIKHHVDHIIPLLRNGWHHEDNMQILPAMVNQLKWADPFWEQEGFKSWRDVPQCLWPDDLAPTYKSLL